MTTVHAGWWRLERRVQRPTPNVSGGRDTIGIEILWSNRLLARQARLLEPEAVGSP